MNAATRSVRCRDWLEANKRNTKYDCKTNAENDPDEMARRRNHNRAPVESLPRATGRAPQRRVRSKSGGHRRRTCKREAAMIYTFHRADGWYPISMPPHPTKTPDQVALDCVPINPGTVKVVNELSGEVIYCHECALIGRQNCSEHCRTEASNSV